MIKTEVCVICLKEAKIFGGHVHKGDETVIVGVCEEHKTFKKIGRTDCKGCYGEWEVEMGYKDEDAGIERIYGTDKSPYLKKMNAKGFYPIAITTMICEETFVFATSEEANDAFTGMYDNEGWYYGLDGEHPWEKSWKDYVDRHYEGDETKAPKVYWLNGNKIKTIKEWKK